MTRVYWDSMLFIYLLEANPVFGPQVQQLHAATLRRRDRLCTSVFTVGEILTGPRKRNDAPGIQGIRQFFASDEIEVLPCTLGSADRYSAIRAATTVHQADAIHLAAAAEAGVDLFVTNDQRLWTLSISGIRFFADLSGKVH